MLLNIAERHKLILKKLKENGFVEVTDLSQEFDVSLVTIRKDLKALEEVLYSIKGIACGNSFFFILILILFLALAIALHYSLFQP